LDDSPIPRCIFKMFFIVACLILAVSLIANASIDTYGNFQDSNCLSFTSVSDFEDLGIIYKVGIILLPLCCYVFFALDKRNKLVTKKNTPLFYRYGKILNC